MFFHVLAGPQFIQESEASVLQQHHAAAAAAAADGQARRHNQVNR